MDEDVGIRTVRDVFQGLQVDDEWSTWSDRGFTWWPHRLAQRVWSDDVREDDGPIVARVNAEIDLFSIGAEDWTNLLPVFEGASTFATMSGFLWNDGVVRLRCSMWVHDDVQAWVARIFQFATLAQAVSAEQSTTEMDQMAVHESGHRDQPDEMLRGDRRSPRLERPIGVGGQRDRNGRRDTDVERRPLARFRGSVCRLSFPTGNAVVRRHLEVPRISSWSRPKNPIHPLGSGCL